LLARTPPCPPGPYSATPWFSRPLYQRPLPCWPVRCGIARRWRNRGRLSRALQKHTQGRSASYPPGSWPRRHRRREARPRRSSSPPSVLPLPAVPVAVSTSSPRRAVPFFENFAAPFVVLPAASTVVTMLDMQWTLGA
jgi:hypothetical protein